MSGRLYSAFLTVAIAVSFSSLPALADDFKGIAPVSASRVFSQKSAVRKSSYEVVASRLKDRSCIQSKASLRTSEAEEASEGISTYGVNVASYKSGTSEVLIRGGITDAAAAAVQVQVIW